VDEIEREGGAAMAVAMKVTDEQRVLVSNVGIQYVDPIEDLSFDDWRTVMAIYLDGAYLTTKTCLSHVYRAKSGTVIYMSSVHFIEALALKAPYVTGKHGLLGLCETVAIEGAKHGVPANIVCPGFVHIPS
jgi:3-hydroxybutyrate dehydrogenase